LSIYNKQGGNTTSGPGSALKGYILRRGQYRQTASYLSTEGTSSSRYSKGVITGGDCIV